MASESRGLQHVNPKAGTFVLCALLIATIGVFLGGRSQGWFEKTLTVRTVPVTLPPDSTLGLAGGAEVQILGSTVGSVTAVRVYEEKNAAGQAELRLQMAMTVRGPLMDLVRAD